MPDFASKQLDRTIQGKIEIGYEAGFALVDLKQTFTVAAGDLLCRHRQSPCVGRALTGRVVCTILRGKTIFNNGKITATGGGKLVKPI
jgi:allantoinase